jgi:hypothetical protein
MTTEMIGILATHGKVQLAYTDTGYRCYRWKTKLYNMDLVGNGLNLCFGRHSGYGGYGSWKRGSRQIRISQAMLPKNTVDTWIRLEDRTISGHVVLNQTYDARIGQFLLHILFTQVYDYL